MYDSFWEREFVISDSVEKEEPGVKNKDKIEGNMTGGKVFVFWKRMKSELFKRNS